MDAKQKDFTEYQKKLIDIGVTPANIVAIQSDNQIQRVVEFCRKHHNGPISNEIELNHLISSCEGKENTPR